MSRGNAYSRRAAGAVAPDATELNTVTLNFEGCSLSGSCVTRPVSQEPGSAQHAVAVGAPSQRRQSRSQQKCLACTKGPAHCRGSSTAAGRLWGAARANAPGVGAQRHAGLCPHLQVHCCANSYFVDMSGPELGDTQSTGTLYSVLLYVWKRL